MNDPDFDIPESVRFSAQDASGNRDQLDILIRALEDGRGECVTVLANHEVKNGVVTVRFGLSPMMDLGMTRFERRRPEAYSLGTVEVNVGVEMEVAQLISDVQNALDYYIKGQ